MIYDRTEADVLSAKQIIENKVKFFLDLTEQELETLSRGTITTETLNRIEEKQKELHGLFKDALYFGEDMDSKTWEENKEIFKDADMEIIVKNGEILRKMFFVYSSTPQKANVNYTYQNLNDIERLLFDLYSMYSFMVDNLKECDTFWCGER